MRADKEPTRPPDVYEESFGTTQEYSNAVIAHIQWWRRHPHTFEACKQCASCGQCWLCAELLKHSVHHAKTQVIERGEILANSSGFRAALIKLVLARRALKWLFFEALGMKVGRDDL